MKTNLSNLMNIANDEERKFTEYGYALKEYVYSISTQELDGTINVIEDRKEDFETAFKNYNESQQKLTKMKVIYNALLTKKNTKQRITEVHNSYFESKTINFDSKKLQKEYEQNNKQPHRNPYSPKSGSRSA